MIVGDGLVDAGVVDQHVDPAAELRQARFPDYSRGGRVGKVAGDQAVTARGRMAGNAVPADAAMHRARRRRCRGWRR